MKLRILLSCIAVAGFASAQEEIRLWPKGAPGYETLQDKEVFEGDPKLPTRFTVSHYPSLYAFIPAKPTGVAMIVAPGGGHTQLVIGKEGYDIARWLNSNGITAFVLKYRLAKAKDSKYTVDKEVAADTARSLRLVRSRAKEWGIDPGKIGFIGFSAGGEVAAIAETRFDAGNTSSSDPIEKVSSRPDFAVVVYPGWREGAITVPKDAPPTFLVCADDDRSHVVTTVKFYLDLEAQGVSTEMHIYANGKHGFALTNKTNPVKTWPDRLKEWMMDKKLWEPLT